MSNISYHVGAGGATHVPPDLGRLVNPIQTKGGADCAHQITTGNPGFPDLPTAFLSNLNAPLPGRDQEPQQFC